MGGGDVDKALFVGDGPGFEVDIPLLFDGLAGGHAPETALTEEEVVGLSAFDGHVLKAALVLLDGEGKMPVLGVQVFGHDGEVFPDVAVDVYDGSRHGFGPSLVWFGM